MQPLPAYESLYTDLLAKTSQDFLVVDGVDEKEWGAFDLTITLQ